MEYKLEKEVADEEQAESKAVRREGKQEADMTETWMGSEGVNYRLSRTKD